MTVRRVVVDDVRLLARDLRTSRRFYEAALAPLGFRLMYEEGDSCAFGIEGADDFAVNRTPPNEGPATGAHVAFVTFVAEDRAAVESFCNAALSAGGTNRQSPALHPEYHTGYYTAYLTDPDGNHIEAVFHDRA